MLEKQFNFLAFADFSSKEFESHVREVLEVRRAGSYVSPTMFIMAHGGVDGETGDEYIV